MGIEILQDKEELLRRLMRRSELDSITGCWLWKGALNNVTHGHGILKLWKGSPKFYTHRLSAYVHLDYDLNSEYQVNHHCSNSNCWNPYHIYVGTQSQNNEDKYKHAGKTPHRMREEWEKMARNKHYLLNNKEAE